MTVVLLYVGAVFEVLDLTLAGLAAIIVTFAVMEMGEKYPIMIYLAASLLSLLLLPNKFPGLVYAAMMGPYPLLKFRLERLPTVPSWILKFLYFNVTLTAIILLSKYVLGLPDTGLTLEIPVYALGNVTYFLFDVALSRLVVAYVRVWRKQLHIGRFFGA